MKKTAAIVIAVVALVAIVGVAAAWIAGAFSAPITRYAPKDSDIAVYVNINKINQHRITKAVKKYDAVKAGLKDAQSKTDIPLDDLLASEVRIFANTDKFDPEKPVMNAIISFEKAGLPAKALASAAKEEGSEKCNIQGKAAVKDKKANVAIIELGKKLLQVSGGAEPVCLTKGPETALAKAIDTGALVSIAYQVNKKAVDMANAQAKEAVGATIPEDIATVTLNLRDGGKDLLLEAALNFKSDKSAAEFTKILEGKLAEAKAAFKETKDVDDILGKIKIVNKGAKITISIAYPVDEIIKKIDEAMK